MILASDFDGTLRQNNEVLDSDLVAIKTFRANGHKFGIVTGRSVAMIKLEIDLNKIPFDFLVCNNGGLICDNQYNVIKRWDIAYDLALELVEYVSNVKDCMIGCSDGFVFGNIQDGEVTLDEGLDQLMEISKDGNKILNNQIINSFYITLKNNDDAKVLYDELTKDFDGRLAFHYNNGTIDVSNYLVNKKTGVDKIKELFDGKIYVVGDGHNDIPMIEAYSGFTTYNADNDVKKAAVKIFDKVADVIRYIVD